jgi:CubicO group peptidase (beta-lactamase class C family)
MTLTRRAFTSGALSATLGSSLAAPSFGQAVPGLAAAFAAIQHYGEAHRQFFNLPGMTLAIGTPNGERRTFNFGFANADARTPITPDTLFQIGSISKVMVALLLHQFSAEGRMRLTDRLSDLLPAIPLPSGNAISVQHLLDHVAGIPGDAPTFPAGGLWTAYAPGAHWHYSNTGYDILGKLAEHLGRKPLAQLLQERILRPLGMIRSRGAIIGADRLQYAQGYEAADQVAPYVRGVPLAPAPWVDVTFGAGSVASTADEMLSFLHALAGAAGGKEMLGLSPQQARDFATHSVRSEAPGMTYGNGLMHVGSGNRAYLHHTGGMLSFSSSFHLDASSGVGAFASSTVNAFAEYRPRLLTLFAVDAVTNAIAGRPLPSPPGLQPVLPNAASYAGQYEGPAGSFEIKAGTTLTLQANGQSAPLQWLTEEIFRTTHPLFRQYSLMFERSSGAVARAAWGPNSYLRAGAVGTLPSSDPVLARLAGRYVNDDPWYGPAPVVERGGRLWFGTDTPMTKIGDNLWRVGRESWSPERASFADFIDGRPQTLMFSGTKFIRHDI